MTDSFANGETSVGADTQKLSQNPCCCWGRSTNALTLYPSPRGRGNGKNRP